MSRSSATPTNQSVSHSKGRSIGFRLSSASHPASTAGTVNSSTGTATSSLRVSAASLSAPLKKQPKGRWFVSAVICSLLGFVGWTLWRELGQYQAYGELAGNVVRVAATARGLITAVHVNDGDYVQPGQLLATIEPRELKLEQTRLQSELQIALANLRVRRTEIELHNRQLQADQLDRQLNYQRFLGEYLAKRAQLDELSRTLAINQQLVESQSVSESEYLASKTAFEGLQAQVKAWGSATETIGPALDGFDVNQATLAIDAESDRVNALENQLHQVTALLEANQLRAPTAGRILRRACNPGESADPALPIFQLLEANSIHARIYLPQENARRFALGQGIRLLIAPLGEVREFEIIRISPEVSQPPIALQNKYRAHKSLVCVHARPAAGPDTSLGNKAVARDNHSTAAGAMLANLLGAELALPRFGYNAALVENKGL